MFLKQVRFNQLEEVSASNRIAISQSIRPIALGGYGLIVLLYENRGNSDEHDGIFSSVECDHS